LDEADSVGKKGFFGAGGGGARREFFRIVIGDREEKFANTGV